MTKALAAYTALCALLFAAVNSWVQLPTFTPLSDIEKVQVMRPLRAALDRKAPIAAQVSRPMLGPLLVTLYDQGKIVTRIETEAEQLSQAVNNAARQLRSRPFSSSSGQHDRIRIQVDLVQARAPIFSQIDLFFSLSLVPGLDGIGLQFGDRAALLTATDLMLSDLSSGHLPASDWEFELGFDTRAVVTRLAVAVDADSNSWPKQHKHFFRFRADTFVEPPDHAGAPLSVTRGNVPGVEPTKQAVLEAAVAAGDYLIRHQHSDGGFDYEYQTVRDTDLGGYSLPRHSGAAYFLAQLYGVTQAARFADAAQNALAFAAARVVSTPTGSCVSEGAYADLGSSALFLVALTEYQERTHDPRYQSMADSTAQFILSMQKSDGDFFHLYRLAEHARDSRAKLLYYSGEATLALAKHALARHDEAAIAATKRGLDFLSKKAYAHFAGQFFFAEDHWTCLAADAAWPALSPTELSKISKFCDQFSAFLRRQQFESSDSIVATQPDFLGAYSFTALLPPHTTPIGSRTEATLSTYSMDRRLHKNTDAVRAQLLAGLGFLVGHQQNAANSYLVANPEMAQGGFLLNDIKRQTRIDFQQHCGSALLRASELLW